MSQFIKPRPPKGFRDFLPRTMRRRRYVIDCITEIFERFGFEPLDTPILELRETLFGKYGEDAEQLIFSAQHGRSASEPLAMRYDLTVPLARVVAQHESQLSLPFKRYHIAPVFRGERPQRGRYREFYQCDADIVGVAGVMADAEIVIMMQRILSRLGFPQFVIKINHRRLLTAIGAFSGLPAAQLPDLYRSVDKFDKLGAEGVRADLAARGIAEDAISRMMDLLSAHTPGAASLDQIENALGMGENGLDELRELADLLAAANVPAEHYDFDFTMARGLGYYTGPIFETSISQPNLGSITGGGRYDNLIGMFRRQSLPTTGTSFGIERIIDLLDELDLYPAGLGGTVVQALVTVFGADTRRESLRIADALRKAGINAELHLEARKLGRQIAYADRKGIPLVTIAGSDEINLGVVKLRRLADRREQVVKLADIGEAAQALLMDS
ncbi:MAG: histidine--tRNA ligase [Chloroflexi bacterium]|nr:histidine--tRNA ligase [Chloroflexota bacterium]MCY4246536.1 histidine--tRNA ligase [Chloroflexota bacterium]